MYCLEKYVNVYPTKAVTIKTITFVRFSFVNVSCLHKWTSVHGRMSNNDLTWATQANGKKPNLPKIRSTCLTIFIWLRRSDHVKLITTKALEETEKITNIKNKSLPAWEWETKIEATVHGSARVNIKGKTPIDTKKTHIWEC